MKKDVGKAKDDGFRPPSFHLLGFALLQVHLSFVKFYFDLWRIR